MKWLIGIGIALIFAGFLWLEHWLNSCERCGGPIEYWDSKTWYCLSCGFCNKDRKGKDV